MANGGGGRGDYEDYVDGEMYFLPANDSSSSIKDLATILLELHVTVDSANV